MEQTKELQLALISLIFLIFIGVFIYTQRDRLPGVSKNLEEKLPVATTAIEPTINLSDSPYLGNPQAKVKIIYFVDFQCPFCQRFDLTTLPLLERDYLKTGKAVLYVKNFQFLGQDSVTAGMAGKCLVQQIKTNGLSYEDSYWPWHKAMFQHQDEENGGWGSATDIKNLVGELKLPGIDIERFNQCLDQGEQRQAIEEERREAEGFGIQGTPGFFINGERLDGAQPYSAFQKVLERHLSR